MLQIKIMRFCDICQDYKHYVHIGNVGGVELGKCTRCGAVREW